MNPTYKDKLTEVWSYYEFGKQYNNAQKPNRYALAETNREFFHGNQWINLPDNDATRRLAKPVFNIIQRIQKGNDHEQGKGKTDGCSGRNAGRDRNRRPGAGTDGAAHEPENITGVPGTETVPAIGEDMESTAENTGEAPPGRDREAEWRELAAAHPEIVGETLPEDIYRECMISELPPIRVYESMMMKKQADRIHALEAELAQLRQNAETAARAPVMGTANAPAPAENDDPFLRGFNAYR